MDKIITVSIVLVIAYVAGYIHANARAKIRLAKLDAQLVKAYEDHENYTSELFGKLQIKEFQINQLRDDVERGRKRLLLAAECEADGTTEGLANGIAARLTERAERHYFDLRSGIELVTAQVKGLQDYAKTCARIKK